MIKKTGLEISNDVIVLKSMNECDSEKYRVLRNRDDNRQMFFSSYIITEEQQKKWYERYLLSDNEMMFSIYEKKEDRYIGAIGIYDIKDGEAEVGRIIVDRELCQGKGYGSKSILLIEKYAKSIDLNSLVAYIYINNIPSQRSFEHAGFIKEEQYEEKYKYKIVF